MAAMAARKTAPEKPKSPRWKGLERVVVRLEPAQIAALKAEARKRATERDSAQVDVSELVRAAIAAWLKRR